ncbi:MAG: GNAT family N-acetyltransferase [Clostridiaceae bacterium]|nr:GNAT family N-acetyltransferase [Clostridiaceae bacterium]
MITAVKNSELEYIKCYSKHKENNDYIKFWDDKFEELYSNNIVISKVKLDIEGLNKLIKDEICNHKKLKKKFFILELNSNMSKEEVDKLAIKPNSIDKFDYLCIDTRKYKKINGNEECNIIKAQCKTDYKQAIKFSLMDNARLWGRDFTYSRIKRKITAYKENDNLSLYLCCKNDCVIGSCELLLNEEVAKIEDFGITKKFQRKGYGKSLIKEMLKVCKEKDIHKAYVVAEQNSLASEIYKKVGFKKVGQKIQLIYEL